MLAAALIACSAGPSPVSRDPNDPSSPAAAEGTDPLRATAARAPLVAPASGSGGAVTYACPMHPEVVSSTPGSCPKCNMTLLPKK